MYHCVIRPCMYTEWFRARIRRNDVKILWSVFGYFVAFATLSIGTYNEGRRLRASRAKIWSFSVDVVHIWEAIGKLRNFSSIRFLHISIKIRVIYIILFSCWLFWHTYLYFWQLIAPNGAIKCSWKLVDYENPSWFLANELSSRSFLFWSKTTVLFSTENIVIGMFTSKMYRAL